MAASPVALANEIQVVLQGRSDVRFALPQPRTLERISTGIPAIDVLTEGGIPRGALTEVYGPASSGRTSLLFSVLARVTANEEYCALIDTSDAFDPASATEAGVHCRGSSGFVAAVMRSMRSRPPTYCCKRAGSGW